MRKKVMGKESFGWRLLLGLCGFALAAPVSTADNWPRFRGPYGAGVAADKGIPVRWTEKDGLLWKKEVPGAGNGSPVVWGRRLFLQTAAGKDRLLLCLDVKDGQTLWKKSILGGAARIHPKNSFASSTPAVDDERVYVLFWDGRLLFLAAYTFEGKLAWRQNLGGFKSQHGAGTSPIVYGDKVILANDQDGAATLLAFEARTGKPAWQAKRRAFRACYSTPFVLENNGRAELIVASTAGITSYNPLNGEENWHWNWAFEGMALRTVASPIAHGDLIFAASGDGSGARHMAAVKGGGKGDVTKTHLVWERKRAFPYVPSMLAKGGHLYCVNDLGIASCHVAATGKTIWSHRLGDGVTASPLLIDGKVYAFSDKGNVYVFPAAATFKLLGRTQLGEGITATPAVAANRLFIRGEKHLFCLGKGQGETGKKPRK
jgi:outer membrane protein assembly factor BamB